ncbi:MAG: serine/threonine protein kinase [bacterium]|nr:serine/threonine protein kinase [bacterium]
MKINNTIIAGTCRYEILRELSSGGMGIVYEANQLGEEGFSKRVAIKEILSSYTENQHFVELFIGEAKLVGDLVHQNIVQIYHLGKRENSYYIVMEYIDGVNLDEFLSAHTQNDLPVPTEIGAFIASRICRGLHYAHNKKDTHGHHLEIVHRDISPKNIMVNYEGEVKIADFGVAKARNYMKLRENEFLLGKAAYMSPEQTRAEDTDGRSDIFTTGTVLYKMLTNVHPFTNRDDEVTISNVTTKEIAPPSTIRADIPRELESIVMKALDRDRTKRFQGAYDMGYALEHFMYHNRFGPNNLTLKAYLEKLIPPDTPQGELLDIEENTQATPVELLTDEI